ncbi:MAG: hypothetical protein WCL07_04195 [bacterium]
MVAENTDGLDKKNFDLSSTDEVNHRGILISGLNALEQNHGLSRENIFLLIDQLPEHFADFTHLGQIIFEPETHYMIQRDGELMLAKESNVLATDKITRMVRGQTIWNSKLVNGDRLPSDGKQTITIYSAKNRTDEKPADVILYSTAHELGHTAYNAVDPNQGPAFWEYLDSANNTNQ